MKGRIFFERQMVTCGNASAIHDSTPDLNDNHIEQHFYQGERIVLFFMGNFYGMLNIELTLNAPDLELSRSQYDCVVSTRLTMFESSFTAMTLPDGDHLDLQVDPGTYKVQMARKTIVSEADIADDEMPEEKLAINLMAL
jgi:hypothetical protein